LKRCNKTGVPFFIHGDSNLESIISYLPMMHNPPASSARTEEDAANENGAIKIGDRNGEAYTNKY
jgi:hypothetical protein